MQLQKKKVWFFPPATNPPCSSKASNWVQGSSRELICSCVDRWSDSLNVYMLLYHTNRMLRVFTMILPCLCIPQKISSVSLRCLLSWQIDSNYVLELKPQTDVRTGAGHEIQIAIPFPSIHALCTQWYSRGSSGSASALPQLITSEAEIECSCY